MTLLQAPLHCAAASGTFIPGLTLRTRRSRTHFIRQATSHKPRTQAQRTTTNFTTALTKLWLAYPAIRTFAEIAKPEVPRNEIYRFWIAENWRRRRDNLYPAREPWSTPSGTPPIASAATFWYHERSFEFVESGATGNAYYMIAAMWTPSTGLSITPRNATHWFQQAKTYWPRLLVDHLPATPIYWNYALIDRYGQSGAQFHTGPFTVPA